MYIYASIYLYTNTVLDGSVILSVRSLFLKLWAPQLPPKRGADGARNIGRRGRPNFFFFLSFTTAEGGGKWTPVVP